MAKERAYFFGVIGDKQITPIIDEIPDYTGRKDLLGGKGANLVELVAAGARVPAGFTLTTDECIKYMALNTNAAKEEFMTGLEDVILENIRLVEQAMGKKFGDETNPLLFSVRSGARASMPGMMDTVLNVGLNDKTVESLAAITGNERFALDCYRRFLHMFGDVVLGIPKEKFEHYLSELKSKHELLLDIDMTPAYLRELIGIYKELYRSNGQDRIVAILQENRPLEILRYAVRAVFDSWNNERAVTYRRDQHIPDDWGTAVNVQAMVFGNKNNRSGTGVGFTRDPATGERRFYGEFLLIAQGEDVVAGVRTPNPISELEQLMPTAYSELVELARKMETHFEDMQDFEFTIQDGILYMLQTRNGKRTAFAALRTAVEMVDEGLITERIALSRMDASQMPSLFAPIFDPAGLKKAEESGNYLVTGIAAGPGAGSGKIVFTAEDAIRSRQNRERVVLVRNETCPDDIGGMLAAEAILTARGGRTSHAAIVARLKNRVCVVGCGDLEINYGTKTLKVRRKTFGEGDYISVDGFTGKVMAGQIPTHASEIMQVIKGDMAPKDSEIYQMFIRYLGWANDIRRLGVRANADAPQDAALAVALGAEGIGLCRTEHMFFEERVPYIQRMILAQDGQGRKAALEPLLSMQRDDFKGIYLAMVKDGKPLQVTIRLLDPPLHEFMPDTHKKRIALSDDMQIPIDALETKISSLHESNPMLGHRGCRLGITYPEIYNMQVRAIVEAALEVTKENRYTIVPEIMIPIVSNKKEIELTRRNAELTIKEVLREYGQREGYQDVVANFKYMIGTMIELPAAALNAGDIAELADFFSFGTNDLTQTTLGISRDDAGKFLSEYIKEGIYERDPFEALVHAGVGDLVLLGVERGRKTKPTLKIGVCGEHGGEPSSINFFHDAGLDYVSCSPARVPVAILAAAQAQLKSARYSSNS